MKQLQYVIKSKPFRYFLKILYRGDNVRCNVCLSNYRRFIRKIQTQALNDTCPGCGSDSAMRTLWFYLTNEVFGEKNKNRFMWFSPPGYIKFKLKKSSIDCVMPGMGYFDIIQSETAEKLPGGLFDVIIFSHLLEYTSDDTVVLHELRRLLRTGGFVLIQTLVNQHMTHKYPDIITANDRDRLKPYYEPGVRQIYGSDFCKFLIRAGFDVEIIQYAYQLGNGAKKYYRLEDNYRSTIYKCKKTEYNANN